jgi:hypothetical protein
MTDDNPPVWMMSDDDHDEPEVEQDEAPIDKNSLAFILSRAVAEIDELGGRERHRLAQTLGRENYDKLMQKPAVARAIDGWLSASPKTKAAAGKVLAVRIAKLPKNRS